MKYLSFVLPFILLIASAAIPTERDLQKSARVKIFKNGQLVIEYTCNKPGAARMDEKDGKESLMINLNSPDNQYALLGTIKTAASGRYAFGEAGQAPAQIEIYSTGTGLPPRLVPDKGQFNITLNGSTCSGNFSGTKTGTDGKKFEITGTFTGIPLVKQGTSQTY